jgi:hypothetical protein
MMFTVYRFDAEMLVVGDVRLKSRGTPAILTEDFRGFSQSLQTNWWDCTSITLHTLPSKSFQFIIH